MKRLVRLFLLAAIISLAAALAVVSSANTWIVVVDTEVYAYEPAHFVAQSYDVIELRTYTATCKLAVIGEDGVVLLTSFTGNPAEYEFTLTEAGIYTIDYYCRDSKGNETGGRQNLLVKQPSATVDYTSEWGRPAKLSIKMVPDYEQLPLVLVVNGEEYNVTYRRGGVTVETHPITAPVDYKLSTKDGLYSWSGTIEPVPPTVKVMVPDTVKPGERFSFSVNLMDAMGAPVDAIPHSVSIDSVCPVTGEWPEYEAVAGVEDCGITVSVVPWDGGPVVVSSAIVDVEELYVEPDIKVNTVGPWRYEISGTVDTNWAGIAVALLLVNDVEVDVDNDAPYKVSYSAELEPGIYTLELVFEYNGERKVITEILEVPRKPYPLPKPPENVYAGEYLSLPNAYWHVANITDGKAVIVVWYPGDSYYAPAYAAYIVNLITPSITLTEYEVIIKGGAPGAKLQVYCEDGRLALEANIPGPEKQVYEIEEECLSVYAVYEYGWYKTVKHANEPEPTELPSILTVPAGAPFTLPADPAIESITIAGTVYKPGATIALMPGVYTAFVKLIDGNTLQFTIVVEPVEVRVVAFAVPGGYQVQVDAPSWLQLTIVTRNGIYIVSGGETLILDEKPVSVDSAYAEASLIIYE